MSHYDDGDPKSHLAELHERLVGWLIDEACPHWSRQGVDAGSGAFFEALGQDGIALSHPRRARVQPRQVYAFAQAQALGWRGDAGGIVARGLRYFTSTFLRCDGLFRTLTAVDGSVLDERALLYDQAFALLGYAAAEGVQGASGRFETQALELRGAIARRLRSRDGSFLSEEAHPTVRESNPHMHLLEACLAWAEIGRDPGWAAWARDIAELGMNRFVRPDSGALGEAFTDTWRPAPGLPGRIVEPGHQFEWAWLLLRSARVHPSDPRPAALRLIAIAEDCGVRNGVAVNALLEDFTVHDPNARLWPQTERLKAALSAAELTGADRYWRMARAAASSLLPYLKTPVPGLWFDVKLPTGELADAPAPASSFYHLVGAIAALHGAVTRIGVAR